MRRTALLPGLLLVLWLAGCGTDAGGSRDGAAAADGAGALDAAAPADARADAGRDAVIGRDAAPDGGAPPDGAPDAPPPDAPDADAGPAPDGGDAAAAAATDAAATDAGPAPDGGDAAATDAAADGAEPPPPPPSVYVIIACDALAAAAQELATLREEAGFVAEVHTLSALVGADLRPETLVPAVRARLVAARAAADPSARLFLVLVGDAAGTFEDPAGWLPTVDCVNPEGDCHTDRPYADLDDDGLPDVAAGRIPARTPAAVHDYVEKVRRHEADAATGLWRRRVSFFAGPPGFGAEIDGAMEDFIFRALCERSYDFDLVGTYLVPSSAYYYAPFGEKVRDLFRDGSLVVLYEGHGSSTGVDGLSLQDVDALAATSGAPFTFLYACSAGDFRGPGDCLAEGLVAHPDGPPTALASTSISHPYGNTILLYETLRVVMDVRQPTIGETVRAIHAALLTNTDTTRRFIDGLALAFDVPAEVQAVLRQTHVDLYSLLGDPALTMPYPDHRVAFDAPEGSVAEGRVAVAGRAPGVAAGEAWITLETERDVIRGTLAPVDPWAPDPAVVQANWATAMDKVVVGVTVPVVAGRFAAELTWAAPAGPGVHFVKVYAQDGAHDAFGALVVH